jgi:hypothetical protein
MVEQIIDEGRVVGNVESHLSSRRSLAPSQKQSPLWTSLNPLFLGFLDFQNPAGSSLMYFPLHITW